VAQAGTTGGALVIVVVVVVVVVGVTDIGGAACATCGVKSRVLFIKRGRASTATKSGGNHESESRGLCTVY
jgi:hypothetical protein